MSDPNRYNIAANNVQRVYGGNMLVVDPDGQLVAYVAYARLQAELADLKSEADRFKAENERLRKAGDEIVSRIVVCTEDLWCSIHRWNAAKDGKPTE